MLKASLLVVVLSVSLVSACAKEQPNALAHTAGGECIIAFSYEANSALSRDVWDYLQREQLRFMHDDRLASGLFYSRGEGVAAFDYAASCDFARAHAARMIEAIAHDAPNAEIANALRLANGTWREIDRAEYERRVAE